VSHLFQRPLCEMGRAYDFAFRPLVGEPSAEDGGPCDDRPHRIELSGGTVDAASTSWCAFSVCPEHEAQLRRYDERLRERGISTRFRSGPSGSSPAVRGT